MAELLGWLQRRLDLQWVDEAQTAAAAADDGALPAVPPPAAALRALDELVCLGYLRGIQKKLDAIDAEHPASAAFTARLRALARGFQLDTLAASIQSALATETPPSSTLTDAP